MNARALRFPALLIASALAACSGAPSAPATPAVGPLAGQSRSVAPAKKAGQGLYVASEATGQILGYPANARGDVAPTVTIGGSNTLLTNPVTLAIDAHGDIYAANDGGSQVLMFPAGSNGNVAPVVLGGSKSKLTATDGIALDATGDLYVSDFVARDVLVFAPGAHGNAAPLRTIAGADTLLTQPAGMAFDTAGNLYVANYGDANYSVVEFAAGASGDATPAGTLGGVASTLDGPFNVSLTAAGGIVVGNTSTSAIDIFTHGATENVAPDVVISGNKTKLGDVTSTGIDAQGSIYATNFANQTYSVLTFAANATGNAKPKILAGGTTGFGDPLAPSFL